MEMVEVHKNLTDYKLTKNIIRTIQINIGNRCNQACQHCHIGASPSGTKNMKRATAEKIIEKLLTLPVEDIEFTGGTPELNPNLEIFIKRLSEGGRKITVRTSLTVLDIPEYSKFVEIYKKYNVRVIASLPGLFPDVTDLQRGRGVFDRSIKMLKRLNALGFGTNGLHIDLVYNPIDTELPPPQEQLEYEYRRILRERYGVSFNNLICLVNSPIGRFRVALEKKGLLNYYLSRLRKGFNSQTLDHLMCRNLLSIDYQGFVYDCDFNLAMGLRIAGYEDKKFWEIDFDNFYPSMTMADHCYACTVGRGSSCQGELVDKGYIKKDIRYGDSEKSLEKTRVMVKEYYGNKISSTSDLKTSACCTVESMPPYIRNVLPYIVDEVKNRFYGCGSPIPPAIEGCRILDLGCGTGRDVFIASKLVGEGGYVIGIDMTDEQLDVATRNLKLQMDRFGYGRPNVEFRKGYMEDLRPAGIEDNSIDVVISNCVINLSPDKEAVFREIFRVLKPGGELYFSDVFSGRRVPDHFRDDPVLVGECLAGAMYIEDFRRLLRSMGILDYRIVSKRRIDLNNPEIEDKVGMIDFYSITVRVFKLYNLEDICEDYGQVALYKGTIPGFSHYFELDDHHRFITGKYMPVCGNTASMLHDTRFRPHFQIIGDRSIHFGPFSCEPGGGGQNTGEDTSSGACC